MGRDMFASSDGYARRMTLVVGICLATVGCNGASHLRNGMQEAEVIQLLGAPAEVITESSLMSVFFIEEDIKSCLPKATRVLVYDRWINDVSVAIDAKGAVVCFEVVTVL
jgi:hypothetical protein